MSMQTESPEIKSGLPFRIPKLKTSSKETKKPNNKPNHLTKQIILVILFSLLSFLGLFIISYLSTQQLGNPFSTITNPIAGLKLLGLTLAAQILVCIGLSIIAILVKQPALSLLPAFITPLGLIANRPHDLKNPVTVGILLIIVINYLMFSYHLKHSQSLYRKFNISRLIAPYFSNIFFSSGLVMALIVFLPLSQNPHTIQQEVKEHLVRPIVNRMIKNQADNANPDQIQDLIPEEIKQVVSTEKLLAQIQNAPLDPQLIENQVITQVDQYLIPLLPFLPVIFAFAFFLSFYQISKIFTLLYTGIVWLGVQAVIATGTAEIRTVEMPVEEIELN